MSDTTTNAPDVEDEESNENLVRDYLLHQLQLNLLHEQWQGKPHAEAVGGLMEAKRIMQEMEDDVVKKFIALNEQYERINGLIDPDKMYELENYQEMLKEIEHLSVKRQTILDKFGGDVKAYMVDHHAQEEQLAKLKTEVQNQREMIAMLNARISEINSKLQSP
ncbi:hypothetical protein LOAG_09281 [Loa loa]|nr:hypothetical protein LOAG_09281 [Loa loa]EFO19213.2 hypothetical protein LOAG_09281 [Loa loa]